jgi:hypothetical protein
MSYIWQGELMPVEVVSGIHVVADKEGYLDAIIDNLSDDVVEWLNEECPSEKNESVPFKPLI